VARSGLRRWRATGGITADLFGLVVALWLVVAGLTALSGLLATGRMRETLVFLPKVTAILRHPWKTKFRGKLNW